MSSYNRLGLLVASLAMVLAAPEPTAAPAVHRVTPDSKRGRQMRGAKGARDVTYPMVRRLCETDKQREQRGWNERVEAKKRERQAHRGARSTS